MVRPRLYDIDFIINRALVYGLLTAFLAGLYAAAIQLFKVLFQDVSGETSDGSIILTTLLLAAAFTPAKNRLQKIVDRYFGPAHAPTKRLDAYVERMKAFVQAIDARESARELLASAVESLTLQGGAVYLTNEEGPIATVGDGLGDQPLRITLAYDDHEAGYLLLGLRLDGLDHSADDIATLETAAQLVARAILLANGRHETTTSLTAVES